MAAEKLTAMRVEKIKKPGYYGDGKGLWLRVKDTGAKSWSFRFMLQGKSREMGLGPYPENSLAEAREKAAELRKQLKGGIDPIEARNQSVFTVVGGNEVHVTATEFSVLGCR